MIDLLCAAKAVVFTFDSPLCRLFHRSRGPEAVRRLRDLVPEASRGAWLPQGDDPHAVLEAALAHPPARESGLAGELARALAEEELRAVPGAYPTAYADALVRTLAATGRQLAVTTRHAEEAAAAYLETRLLDGLFAGRLHGLGADGTDATAEARGAEGADPGAGVRRALESLRAPAHAALLIGGAPGDVQAARAAGVPFLGYACDEERAQRLRAAGAEHTVESLREVLTALDPGAHV